MKKNDVLHEEKAVTSQGNPNDFLFQPLRIGSMELPNRIVLPPMTTLLAEASGELGDRFIEFYAARARGGAGLITAEAADVHPYTHNLSIGDRGFAALYDDRFLASQRRLTQRLHAEGACVSVQLHHCGSAMVQIDPNHPPLAPSPIPYPGGALPRELDISEIEEIVAAYGAAARRARGAGFDAVDIHGGHGYLIAQFMSPFFNRRTDSYGGDLAGRLRFPIEVLQAVRQNVGADFPIIFRLSAEERVSGGRDLLESVTIAPRLVEAGADCLSITTGMHFTLGYTVAPMGQPRGLNVAAAAAIKQAVRVPVMVAGKLNDPALASAVLASGQADLIAIGRGLIADPDWPIKVRERRVEDVRSCISCNQGCIGGMIAGIPFTCLVNPEAGRELETQPGAPGRRKRVFVAGGGPAGMEAARRAAMRGHEVVLYESHARLGGQFWLASLPPRKHEISPYLRYLIHQLEQLGVERRLGTALTAQTVAEEEPDAVVVATGSTTRIPEIPGIDGPQVVTAHAVLAGTAQTGESVLVLGGGQVGCETAEFLDRYGKQVTIAEMRSLLAADLGTVARDALLDHLAKTGIVTRTSARVEAITADGVILQHEDRTETLGGFNSIVLACGAVSSNRLARELEGKVPELYVIGDATAPASAMEAIAAAAALCI